MRRKLRLWGMALITLLAFALRAFRLDNQSLWSDEYITLLRSAVPLRQVLAEMPAEHAPLYFVIQHFWLRLAGESDFALRFPSVIGGVLAVPLIYFLGKALFRREVGGVAAFVLTVNPFHVWYSQEARMYALLTAFVLGSLACLALALWKNRARWWAGYVIFTLLSIYTHYYAGLAIAAGVFIAIVWIGIGPSMGAFRKAGRVALARHWLAAQFAIALGFLPWLPRALQILSFPGWRRPADLSSLPARYLTYYSVGTSIPFDVGWKWTLGLLIFAGLGVVYLTRNRSRGGVFLAGYLLVPLGIIALQALRNPDFHERYFISITPAYYLLIAVGITWIASSVPVRLARLLRSQPALSASGEVIPNTPARRHWSLLGISSLFLATLGLLYVAGAGAMSLRNHYFDPGFDKAGYEAYTQHIREVGRPQDALVLNGPGHGLTLRYGGEERKDFPKVYNLQSTSNRDKSRAEIEQLLTEIAREHSRVWLAIQFREPGEIKGWFERHGYRVEGGWVRDILLYYYAFPPEAAGAWQTPTSVEGDAPVSIAGYRVTPQVVSPGDILHLAVVWEAEQPVPFNGKISARLKGPDGEIWASLDRPPMGGVAPTPEWEPGERIEDRCALRVPADAPAGEYRLLAILYDGSTLAEHLRVNLGAVVVTAERASRQSQQTHVSGASS